MRVLAVLLVAVVLVAGANAGRGFRKYMKLVELQCKEEVGDKDEDKPCLISCKLDKMGVMQNGEFAPHLALNKIAQIPAKNHRVEAFKERMKKAIERCDDEIGVKSQDKCLNAAAIYYCIKSRVHKKHRRAHHNNKMVKYTRYPQAQEEAARYQQYHARHHNWVKKDQQQ